MPLWYSPKIYHMEWTAPSLAISPDGRRFAYVAVNNGIRRLYVRQIDESHFRPLKGTEGAVNPFFKPDGEWLGFYSDGKLKKVAFSGGILSDICAMPGSLLRATWNRDGSIIFCDDRGCLWKMPDGGNPEIKIFDAKSQARAISFPRLRADGKTVLVTGRFSGGSNILSLPSGAVRTILDIGSNPLST